MEFWYVQGLSHWSVINEGSVQQHPTHLVQGGSELSSNKWQVQVSGSGLIRQTYKVNIPDNLLGSTEENSSKTWAHFNSPLLLRGRKIQQLDNLIHGIESRGYIIGLTFDQSNPRTTNQAFFNDIVDALADCSSRTGWCWTVDLPPGQIWQQATVTFLDTGLDKSGLENGKGHLILGHYAVSMLSYYKGILQILLVWLSVYLYSSGQELEGISDDVLSFSFWARRRWRTHHTTSWIAGLYQGQNLFEINLLAILCDRSAFPYF